jgi:hypothetical protein
VQAHDHADLGGMIDEDGGFVRKRMARGIPPEPRDLRDWRLIEAWARGIANALTHESHSGGGNYRTAAGVRSCVSAGGGAAPPP